MNAKVAIGILVLAIALVANAAVSIAVIRSGYYSRNQKLAQVCIVWLLPLLGPLLVGTFLYSQRDNTMFNTRAYPEPDQKAVPYAIHESLQGHEHAP